MIKKVPISNDKSNHHSSVLLKESINLLNINTEGIYVDCTLGLGGHSKHIIEKLNHGKLFCFEQDEEAIESAKKVLKQFDPQKFEIIKSNFKNLDLELFQRGIKKVDGFIFDLGVSSPQLDNDYRGFSYKKNFDLDMRMDLSQDLNAKKIINEYDYEQLRKIFFQYGEEPNANKIAKNIIKRREKKTIETTLELVDVIKEVLPQKILKKKKHPCKKVFQAIRIAVNNELDVLVIGLSKALKLLNKNGRIVVISFHSLEDRIVKKMFTEACKIPEEELYKYLPVQNTNTSNFELVTKKAVKPSLAEIERNPRSHSATMRVLYKK
ncbi:16S rRNA (cytosine(1402)-N(4))-methyltransferase RsmH [Spiroplasma endosymbiont of Amphibalanus improvisus]|uniref:16S rRNA (cytosine(1402)-N(4))-methyltransferase RsmH n=1 Tax=Spiroplasma endosymbiont of Amphibalanus improvisus TaxID=3066327 RepID=UPI00313EB0C4